MTSIFQSFLPSKSNPALKNCLTRDLVVKKLFIHPIKSCKGSQVQSSEYDNGGLKYDRTWLIVSAETGKFFTARDLPEMVLIRPTVDQERNKLIIEIPLNHKGKKDEIVEVTLDPSQEELESYEVMNNIFIWKAIHNGYAISKEADTALSLFFEKPVRLIRKGFTQRWPGLDSGEESKTKSASKGWKPSDLPIGPSEWSLNSAFTRWQDFYPLLIASETSLDFIQKTLVKSVYPDTPPESEEEEEGDDDKEGKLIQPGVYGEKIGGKLISYKIPAKLNKDEWSPDRLAELQIERFRPNILLTNRNESSGEAGLTPFEEDAWTSLEVLDSNYPDKKTLGKEIKGKGKGIYCLARCARCQVPCIDPKTAKRDAFIPYRILQNWRMVEPASKKIGKPCFGMLSVSREKSGTIKVGDLVRVTGVTDPLKRVMGEKLPEQKPSYNRLLLIVLFFITLFFSIYLSGESFF